MRHLPPCVVALVAVTGVAYASERDSTAAVPPIGTRIGDFSLPRAADGQTWSLAENATNAKAVVVLFLGTECPVSNSYAPTLAALHRVYSPKRVVFVGVNSNQQDDAAAVAKHAKEYALPFPVLKDNGSTLADRFRAERVPEAFVLDGNRTVRYRGRIDDQFGKGIKRPKPSQNDLRDALDAVLSGKAVARPVTEVAGCPISRSVAIKRVALKGEPVFYTKHVARIIQEKCQECHRPGEAAPFQLMSYKDAAAWADAIREVVAERRMPPWFADPAHGKFVNDRRLSDSDLDTLVKWVDQGCAEGDPKDLPPPRHYVKGWGIGTPDEIIPMNMEYRVSAQAPPGGIPYKYVLAGKPFTEDRWVQAAEVRPGNRAVLHHVIAYVVKPGKERLPHGNQLEDEVGQRLFNNPTEDDPDAPDAVASFVPGDQITEYPVGLARRITKGSQLIFELHYTPNGKEGTDRSSVGIVYAKAPPKHEVKDELALNWRFIIPPGADNYRIVASTKKFPKDIVLLSMMPHMHLRGKSFEYCLVLPDGKREVLLSVPRYDFNWQLTYVLAEPRTLPKGSRLECTACYDNSRKNPNNPNPWKFVTWGDQTWDEMMIGFFECHDADSDSVRANGK
jgi:thiol-disulfide isomerase/thioredoxin